eukprot:6614281-Alexandrium_andersonii.AAC.1
MSASLVGSEMCIRDRSTVLPWKNPLGTPIGTSGTAPFVDRSGLSANSGCLLYTSDAADDM